MTDEHAQATPGSATKRRREEEIEAALPPRPASGASSLPPSSPPAPFTSDFEEDDPVSAVSWALDRELTSSRQDENEPRDLEESDGEDLFGENLHK